MKAQRIKDGSWPFDGAAATPAREKLAALRERVRARAAGTLGSSSTAETRPLASVSNLCGRGGGDIPSESLPSNIGGDFVQHRGEREQLVNELPLDLRIRQTNEVSQMHSVSWLGGGAGGASTSAASFAAASGQAADCMQRIVGGEGSQQRGIDGAGLAGTAIRTAMTVAASHTAWHTDVAEAAP